MHLHFQLRNPTPDVKTLSSTISLLWSQPWGGFVPFKCFARTVTSMAVLYLITMASLHISSKCYLNKPILLTDSLYNCSFQFKQTLIWFYTVLNKSNQLMTKGCSLLTNGRSTNVTADYMTAENVLGLVFNKELS